MRELNVGVRRHATGGRERWRRRWSFTKTSREIASHQRAGATCTSGSWGPDMNWQFFGWLISSRLSLVVTVCTGVHHIRCCQDSSVAVGPLRRASQKMAAARRTCAAMSEFEKKKLCSRGPRSGHITRRSRVSPQRERRVRRRYRTRRLEGSCLRLPPCRKRCPSPGSCVCAIRG